MKRLIAASAACHSIGLPPLAPGSQERNSSPVHPISRSNSRG